MHRYRRVCDSSPQCVVRQHGRQFILMRLAKAGTATTIPSRGSAWVSRCQLWRPLPGAQTSCTCMRPCALHGLTPAALPNPTVTPTGSRKTPSDYNSLGSRTCQVKASQFPAWHCLHVVTATSLAYHGSSFPPAPSPLHPRASSSCMLSWPLRR